MDSLPEFRGFPTAQRLKQRLDLLEVGGVKALDEPVIEGHAHAPQILLSKKWP